LDKNKYLNSSSIRNNEEVGAEINAEKTKHMFLFSTEYRIQSHHKDN